MYIFLDRPILLLNYFIRENIVNIFGQARTVLLNYFTSSPKISRKQFVKAVEDGCGMTLSEHDTRLLLKVSFIDYQQNELRALNSDTILTAHLGAELLLWPNDQRT